MSNDKKLLGSRFTALGTQLQGIMVVHADTESPPEGFIGEFCATIRQGLPLERACLKHSLSFKTLERWMENALQGDAGCIDFFQSVIRSEVEFEEELVKLAIHGKNNQMASARTMLQDRFPENWAKEAESKSKPQSNTAVVVLPAQTGSRHHVETHTIDVGDE